MPSPRDLSPSPAAATSLRDSIIALQNQRRHQAQCHGREDALAGGDVHEQQQQQLHRSLLKLHLVLSEYCQHQQRQQQPMVDNAVGKKKERPTTPLYRHASGASVPIDFDNFASLFHDDAVEGEAQLHVHPAFREAVRQDCAGVAGRALPVVQWPLPAVELRVRERHRRDEAKRQRQERRRRRQQLAERSTGPGIIASAVAARLLCAATGSSTFLEAATSPAPAAAVTTGAHEAEGHGSRANASLSVATAPHTTTQVAKVSSPSRSVPSVTGDEAAAQSITEDEEVQELASPRSNSGSGGGEAGAGAAGSLRTSTPPSSPHPQTLSTFLARLRTISTSGGIPPRAVSPDSPETKKKGRAEAPHVDSTTPRSFVLSSPGSSGFYFSDSLASGKGSEASSLSSSQTSIFSTDSTSADGYYRGNGAKCEFAGNAGGQYGSPHSRTSSPTTSNFLFPHAGRPRNRNEGHDKDDGGSGRGNSGNSAALPKWVQTTEKEVQETVQEKHEGEGGAPDAAAANTREGRHGGNKAQAAPNMDRQQWTGPPTASREDGSSGDEADTHTHRTALAEMDDIDHGLTAPYRAYLFSPHARVLDLHDLLSNPHSRQTSSGAGSAKRPGAAATAATATTTLSAAQPQWGRSEDGASSNQPSAAATAGPGGEAVRTTQAGAAAGGLPPTSVPTDAAIAATCVAFSPAGTCYLVGSSLGTLLFFAVARASEDLMHATYLGSLRRDGGGPSTSSARALHASARASSFPGAVATAGSLPSVGRGTEDEASAPAVLTLAHTAAVTTIAFSDDGGMFASASVDGSVMLWSTATQAKLRRLRIGVRATSPSPSSSLADTAPRIVLFTPFNNNYLLVCSRKAGILYNGSTGLPVAVGQHGAGGGNGGGGGSSSSSSAKKLLGGMGSITGLRRRSHATTPSFITAAYMDPISAPFFFLGDSQGNVQMCTYRAGEAAVLPTLCPPEEEGQPHADGAGGGRGRGHAERSNADSLLMGGGGEVENYGNDVMLATTLSRQLPELRRVAYIALDNNASASNSSSVTGSGNGAFAAPFYPIGRLEVCAMNERQCRSILKAQQQIVPTATEQRERGLWPACEEKRKQQAEQQQQQQMQAQHLLRSGLFGRRQETAASPPTHSGNRSGGGGGGGGGNGVEHALLDVPNKIAGAFSSLFAAASSAFAGGKDEASANREARGSTARDTPAQMQQHPSPPSPLPASSARPLSASAPGSALRHLCPLSLLVSQPCDCVSLVGVMVEFPYAATIAATAAAGRHDNRDSSRHRSHRRPHEGNEQRNSSASQGQGMKGPPVYSLVRLLDVRGVCRLRHVGLGAVPVADNPKLLAMAIPCEEGFVRVVSSSAVGERRAAASGGAATATATANERSTPTLSVLATLPMPCGGVCKDLAWSPDGRYLVAVTAEGVLYQWERIYLLGESLMPTPAATVSTAVVAASSSPPPQPPQWRGEGGGGGGEAIHGAGRKGRADSGDAVVVADGGGERWFSAGDDGEFPNDLHSAAEGSASARGGGRGPRTQVQQQQHRHQHRPVGPPTPDLLELEEERWRESLFRERLHQLTVRRQVKASRHCTGVHPQRSVTGSRAEDACAEGGGGGTESSGYWLGEGDDNTDASSRSSQGGVQGGGGDKVSTND